jgi:2-polyprenyl-6-methoxyphenol hydroxylase-like FAD-dependent oxidoreductase
MLSATVLIVGSGPVGLWLAYELRNAKLDVLIIDSIPGRDKRKKYSKALSMSAGSLETLASRGVVSQFLESGIPMHKMHFGALPTLLDLNSGLQGVQHPYNLAIPQARTEKILLDLCDNVGVRFAWGTEFLSLVQEEQHILVTASNTAEEHLSERLGTKIEASWVVGCDGQGTTRNKTASRDASRKRSQSRIDTCSNGRSSALPLCLTSEAFTQYIKLGRSYYGRNQKFSPRSFRLRLWRTLTSLDITGW